MMPRQNALPGCCLESKPLLTWPACQKEIGALTPHLRRVHQSLFWNAQSRFSLCLKSEGFNRPPTPGGRTREGRNPELSLSALPPGFDPDLPLPPLLSSRPAQTVLQRGVLVQAKEASHWLGRRRGDQLQPGN